VESSNSDAITRRGMTSTAAGARGRPRRHNIGVAVGPELLITRLKAIREPEVRVAVLVSALSDGDPGHWIEAFASIVRRAHTTDDVDAAAALETIAHAAGAEQLPYPARQRLYEAAARLGYRVIARLFLAASPVTIPDALLAKQLAPERALRTAGKPLTLGERKSLARTRRRDLIIQVVRDPHPDVIAILLVNPHVIEADVVQIAARRPAVPETLLRVAEHPRWSLRQQVKRALVWNPATPLDVAIRMATTLRTADLREIAADETLPAPLRGHVEELLATARVAVLHN
jgi:hypothetical protein